MPLTRDPELLDLFDPIPRVDGIEASAARRSSRARTST
jgi:hypothetical protein